VPTTPKKQNTSGPERKMLSSAEIKAALTTRIMGKSIHVFEEIDSTNDQAYRLAEHGAKEGTLVVAERQTKGRGRLGRSWYSPAGLGIWMSVILRPDLPPATAPALSLVAGLSLARTIEDHLDLNAELKWPNDCLLDGKKTAGILTELSAEKEKVRFVVLGVGINVLHQRADFPAGLQNTATSLALAARREIDRVQFLCAFLRQLEDDYQRFKKEELTPFLDPYTKRCGLIGARVRAQVGNNTISGRAVRIDPTGALVIARNREEIVVRAGDVERIR